MKTDNITSLDKVFTKIGRMHLKLNSLVFMYKASSNWYDAILFNVGLKPGYILLLRNGKAMTINRPEDYNNLELEKTKFDLLMRKAKEKEITISKNLVKFVFGGKQVKFYYNSPDKLRNIIGYVTENFIDEQFKWLDVSGKDILDIGANIGDTAVYFSLKGASHVYAVEPYAYLHHQSKKNMGLNGLQKRVTLIHAGCGPKEAVMRMSTSHPGTPMRNEKHGAAVRVTTLANLVKKHHLNNAVLKMDCEGGEYDIILDAPDSVLLKFEQLMLEYHHGYMDLKKRLEKVGFRVRNTMPRHHIEPRPKPSDWYVGMLYAERVRS